MAGKVQVFSEEELAMLRMVIDRERRRSASVPQRPAVGSVEDEWQTSQVYLVKTPPEGIGAMADTAPGAVAQVPVYQIVNTSAAEDTGTVVQELFNISTAAPGSEYGIAVRDAYGSWLFVPLSSSVCPTFFYGWGGSGETGSGTATATLDLSTILDQHDQPITSVPDGTMMTVIVTVMKNGSTPVGAITPPAGWTTLKTDTFASGDNSYWIGAKTKASGETSYNWTWGNSGEGTIRAILCDASASPVLADAPDEVSTGTGTSTTVTVPSDLTSTHLLFYYVWTDGSAGTFANPSTGSNLGNLEPVYSALYDYTSRGIAVPDGPSFITQTWNSSATYLATCVAIPIAACTTPWLFVVDRYAVASSPSLAVGTTTVSGGTAFGVLYNNGGVLANVAPTESGQLFISGSLAWVTMSGDASISSSGALTLANSGVTATTYGDSTHVAQVTVDAKGRVTAASSVAITASPSGAAGGDLSGTYPNPVVAKIGGTSITTAGAALATLANPSAITFLRVNADNTVSALDAATFRTAIGAGSGTVTSVGISVSNGINVLGSPVTTSGSIALSLGTISPLGVVASGPGSFIYTDTVTNAASPVFSLGHNSSGTVAAGFGLSDLYTLQSSTTVNRNAALDTVSWVTATDASRKARRTFAVYDTIDREYLRGEASGSAAMIGFLGAAASAALASPDLGTLATTFGLATGTPTFTAANLTGTVPTARLGSGTANSGSFLRGDQTWQAFDTDTTLAANSNTVLASQHAVKTYVDNKVVGLLNFKGSTDCSANPNYPAAVKGDSYVVSVAGKIGGASGTAVDVGDWYVAEADNAGGTEASVGASWGHIEHNLVGALLSANNLSDVASTSAARSNLGLAIGTNVQAWDSDLDALAALAATAGMLSRTGAGAFAVRTITGTSGKITVTNGDGASGNPTLTIDSTYAGQSTIVTVGTLTGGATGAGFTLALATSTITGTIPDANLAAIGTAGTYTKVTTDAKGRVSSGTTQSSTDLPQRHNLLANGGAWFFQRSVAGTLTSVSDDSYCADRWNALTQTAAIQFDQTVGNAGPYALRIKQNQVAAQRMGVEQIVESNDSFPMRGRTVRFQFNAKCSTTTTLRYAILEWTGTADAVTSDVVNDWTSGTYTASNFFLAANLAVTAVGSTSVGTGYTACSLTGAVSSSCNNLIVMVWTEGTAAQNVTVELSDVILCDNALSRDWLPDSLVVELDRCQRYCFSLSGQALGLAQNGNNLYNLGALIFPTTMRATPTLRSGAAFSVNAGAAGTVNIQFTSVAGTAFGNGSNNWTATAIVSVTCVLEAEL